MKNRYLTIGILAFTVSLISCKDTLDTNPTATFSDQTVWGSMSTAESFVYATYAAVLPSTITGSGSCITWEGYTPNSLQADMNSGIDNFTTELSISSSSDFGSNRFSLLRRCNLIIQKANESSLTDAEKAELITHARFLRGLIFWNQTRLMGRFVPLTEVLSEDDEENCKVPMTSSVAESYEYVMDDLQAGVDGLPETAESGLPTKYAAEVILSRACLQAYAYTKDESYLTRAISAAKDVTENCSLSSDYGGMFNETNDQDDEILWGYYRLNTNSYVVSFSELIYTYPNIKADDEEISQCPVRLKNANGLTFEAWGCHYPTQDLVDAYLVTDEETGEALPWDQTSQYTENVDELSTSSLTSPGQVDSYNRTNGDLIRIPTAQDFNQTNANSPVFTHYAQVKSGSDKTISELIYQNRDARFYTSIVYDQCTWLGEDIELNLGGNLSAGVKGYENGGWMNTVSGYYWRKNTLESLDPRAFYSVPVNYHYCLARTGEAYMNLAEAYLLQGNISEAVAALNATRTTHGKLAPSTATTEEEAWEDYIRERTVEMTNEGGDLYFSYLRWGKYGGYANHGRPAGDIIYDLDRPVYKIEISRDRKKMVIGQITMQNAANRTFSTKRYLLPINQSFLDTREAYGLDHEQNEGW